MLVTDEVANTNMSEETLDVRDISRGPITVSHQPPFFFMRSFATEECMKTILKLFNIIRIGSDAVILCIDFLYEPLTPSSHKDNLFLN